jgi:hypothetical protein
MRLEVIFTAVKILIVGFLIIVTPCSRAVVTTLTKIY